MFWLYAFWDLYIHKLIDEAIQKDCFDIYLIVVEVKESGIDKQDFEGHWLYDSGKSLIKIYFQLLEIVFDHPSSFKACDFLVNIVFNFIDPFFSKNFVVNFHLILMY